ncbi:MAG: group 1 truncated hemoglobin [Gammaproteobacteria bacterium]|nr:group 1 truncated hemoglobin [Gammaproteobacteria bacterium]
MNEKKSTLYERIGGQDGVVRLVDIFYSRVLGDDSINQFFSTTSMDQLKNMQQEFFSLALGGPSKYSDIDLSMAHKGKGIQTRHFKAFVENLFSTLAEFDLNENDRYEIISTLNTYVEEITDDSPGSVI